MKKVKILTLIISIILGLTIPFPLYSNDIKKSNYNLSPEGYWIQFNEDDSIYHGIPEGIIHTYFAKNDRYGKKGTLQMEIAIPLMYINSLGKPSKPRATCYNCSNSSYNGFNYNAKNAPLKNFVFAGNMQKKIGTSVSNQKSDTYVNGGVINPNDGKVYSSEAQVQDNGNTMFAKASYILWGKKIGSKSGRWIRITKNDYDIIKKDCDINNNGQYLNKDKKISSMCINYPIEKLNIKKPI